VIWNATTSDYVRFHQVYTTEPTLGVTITGVTYDKTGTILGSCDVFLCKDNGDNTASFIAYTTSNAVTGVYSFFGDYTTASYFVIAWKDDSPHVFDCTDHVLQGS